MSSANPSANKSAWPTDQPFIVLDHIRKVFKTSGGEALALNDINAQIYQGEFVSVIGRSGSGKSTLANMITGIDHPTSGNIRVGTTTLNGMAESPMSIWRGNNLGIVFQFFQLLPMLTLIENVMLPMDFCGYLAPEDREKRAADLLELVGLAGHEHHLPASISGGQQQCTAIARALANDPPILIADEPTGNLDSKTAEVVMNLFENLSGQGKTIIMVTHDNSLASRTHRKLVIADGELIIEEISRHFPDLDHSQLMDLSHAATKVELDLEQRQIQIWNEPGVILITSGKFGFRPSEKVEYAEIGAGHILDCPLPEKSGLKRMDNQPITGLTFPKPLFYQSTGLPHPEYSESKQSKNPIFKFLGFRGQKS